MLLFGLTLERTPIFRSGFGSAAPLADVQAVLEGWNREPGDSLDEVLGTGYLQSLVLRYLREQRIADPAVTRQARQSLEQACAAVARWLWSGTESEPHLYPGSYVEYVERSGHEAPGMRGA